MNIQQCTLGEIVAKDARAAAIFEQYDIDFCCNGHRTLQQACPDKAGAVAQALTGLPEKTANDATAMDYRSWPLDLLADLIEKKYHRKPPMAPWGTVDNPIRVLSQEHQAEGDRFREIAELTDDYIAPADGCQTYRLTFHELKEFETMLHFHIHLENNLLFPRALEMAANPEINQS